MLSTKWYIFDGFSWHPNSFVEPEILLIVRVAARYRYPDTCTVAVNGAEGRRPLHNLHVPGTLSTLTLNYLHMYWYFEVLAYQYAY